jgi:FKBP-type peptidyl-prolyl cis-trans isomerase FklB
MKMNRHLFCAFAVVLVASLAQAQDPPLLKTPQDKVNYGIGVNVARNFKQQGIDVDLDMVIKGMRDGLSGDKLLITEEDLRATMTKFQNELRLKQAAALRSAGDDNKKKGEAFLSENENKEGVVALPSGLQGRVLRTGEGKKPTDEDTVEIRYRGTLIDGFRQFGSQRSTGRNPESEGHGCRLQGSPQAHVCGLQVATLHPAPTGLRDARFRPRGRTKRHPHLRDGTPRGQMSFDW